MIRKQLLSFVILAIFVSQCFAEDILFPKDLDTRDLFGPAKNPSAIIEDNSYPAENHAVVTEDGYILGLQRIPYGLESNNCTSRTPILLVHGFLGSGAMYVELGPNQSLAYYLADLCYDVWLFNARGTCYSQDHISINITENPKQFFDFSWHEIGYYDLAASIDYILNVTARQTLQFVSHSQGCTAFFVLASTRPEYNDKIALASLMGPPAFMSNTPSDLVQLLANNTDILSLAVDVIGLYQIPGMDIVRALGPYVCSVPELSGFCLELYNLMLGFADPDQFDLENTFYKMLFTTPSDASVKQLKHYGQIIKSGYFRQFDYGIISNLLIYGSSTPPNYNLTAITAPVALYYGNNDVFVSPIDVNRTAEYLPNIVEKHLVEYELFNHGDFLYAIDSYELIYKRVLDNIQRYS